MRGMKVLHRLLGAALSGVLLLTACAPGQRSAQGENPSGPCESANQVKPEYELSQRVTFVLAAGYGENSVDITHCLLSEGGYSEQWRAKGFSGSTGFAKPGPVYVNSLLSPTGSYSVTEAFGRTNPGTNLPYEKLRQDSYWGGRHSAHFNNYFEGAGQFPDEPLWKYMQAGDYEQAAVINYNRPPEGQPVPGQSFAIFLHAGMRATWGCISTDLGTVEKYLRQTQPGDRIVMGVKSEIFGPTTSPA
ncbi:hypothetical protein ACTXJE_10935 [Glutamicibacter ardleyensis]|uniref:YkuD domain-containing protein n=2 Tax=Micrococcaceae TaxID=1268 RepID=A0ABQ2DCZ4_9MICC|nr:hypothetical protein GCM10007173_09070 [Glutamicibacter ardleyensis]